MESQRHGAFEAGLAALAGELTRLRIERGRPSYRDLVARAEASRTGIRLSVATQSDAFNGRRLVRADTLMGLVRMLYAYDEYGRETAIPSHTAPELVAWRRRWQELAALQPGRPPRPAEGPDQHDPQDEPPFERSPDPPAPHPDPAGSPRPHDGQPTPPELRRPHPTPHPDPNTEQNAEQNAEQNTPTSPEPERGPAPSPEPTPAEAPAEAPAPAPAPAPDPYSTPPPYTLRHRVNRDSAPASAVVFSPDGRLLASGGPEAVRLWDTATGRPTTAPLTARPPLAFTPDGLLIAGSRNPQTLFWFDPATGRVCRPPLTFYVSGVTGISCAPSGSTAAAVESNGTVHLCSPDAGRRPVTLAHGREEDPFRSVAFARDGRVLAATHGGRVKDLVGKKELPRAALAPGSGAPEALSFSPDGRLLALGYRDGRAALWETAGGRDGPPLAGHADAVFALTFSPDGRLLATGSRDTTVRLWDTATGRPVGPPLTDHTTGVEDIAFSLDGRLLATASDDGVLLYERAGTSGTTPSTAPTPSTASPGTPLASRALEAALSERWAIRLPSVRVGGHGLLRVAFSPDGRVLATTSLQRALHLLDPVTRAPLGPSAPAPPSAPHCLAFSPNAALLATESPEGVVCLRDPLTGAVRRTWRADQAGASRQLVFSPDGRLLASLAGDGSVLLRTVPDGEPVGGAVHDLSGSPLSTVTVIAFSPDGRILAAADSAGDVRLWRTGTHVLVGGPYPGARALAFSPDGRTLAAPSGDSAVRLWDLDGSGRHGSPLSRQVPQVNHLAFSPDGSLLATAGHDGVVLLWDPVTRELVDSAWAGHGGPVNGLAFSPDGSLLATVGADSVLNLWAIGPLRR
ncbi:hypothetical protein ACFV7Q_33065 [Streptomyces sp. NPDC059851]|uniref:hypothetical protein n=1 Tax=Streptomyces sp. NPDC059851 TaxID=3346971 RepID=UPI0036620C53